MALLRVGIALVLAVAGCSKPAQPRDEPCDDCTDTATETEVPGECTGVTFTDSAGDERDLTKAFSEGEYTTLRKDGTLKICPGEWFVRLTTTGKVAVEGDDKGTTTLSGGDSDTVVTVADGTLSVTRVHIDRGHARGSGNASKGGGILCEGGRKVTITDSTFTNNTAFDGGAIFATAGCDITATDVVFTDNTADDDGGTIGAYFDVSITLSRVTIEGGTARDGGGIFVFDGELDIADSTLSGNTATQIGGAIMNYESPMTVRDTTFSGNRAESGGAILNVGYTTLERVDFTGNEAEDGGAVFAYTSATTEGTQCGFSANTPDDIAVGANAYTFGETVDFLCDGDGCDWDPVGIR